MTKSDFRELILLQVRKFLPEVPSWDDMARFVRVAGEPVLSPDNLSYVDDMTVAESAAFKKYASILRHERDTVVFNLNNGDESFDMEQYHLSTVEDLAFADGHNQPRPTFFPLKSTVEVPFWQVGRRLPHTVWLMRGTRVFLLPPPGRDITVFVRGVISPHYEPVTERLVAVTPGDEYSLARYIAAEFLEPFNPQVAQIWRQESIAEWVLERQKRAWERRYTGRNRTRAVR